MDGLNIEIISSSESRPSTPPTVDRQAPAAAPSSDGRSARALGWFSLALGVAELAAPGAVAALVGAEGNRRQRNTLRGIGLREVAAGIGILARPQSSRWLWTRVAGDLMDLAFLRAAGRSRRAKRQRLWMAAGVVAGVTALDTLASLRARSLSDGNGVGEGAVPSAPVAVLETISVNRPISEVFAFWRDFENLPRFMRNLESIEVIDSQRSRWRAKGPAGQTVEWDAEIIDERPDELISWRSCAGADVANAGTVRFLPAPGNRGTELHVQLEYQPPAGRLGAMVAWLWGKEPGQTVKADLRRLKQVLEIGEVMKSDASIHHGRHAAQPSSKG
jgi:uncharacterized membrane protein